MRLVMNVDSNYNCFTLEEKAAVVKNAGFQGVDYGLFDMKTPDSTWFQPDWQQNADQIRNAFASEAVPVVQTHAPFSFPEIRDIDTFMEKARPLVVHAIEVSAALGAKCVVVHPIQCIPYKENAEALFRANMDYYRSLIPVCKSCGIKVGIENMFQRDRLRGNRIIHSTCAKVEEFCRYIDTLDSDYMVACLDIGHTVLPTDNAEPWDFIRILGHDRLHTLHVHDNDFIDDRHNVPFSGKIDWYRITEALGEIDYIGDFVYEVLLNSSVPVLKPEMYPAFLSYMASVGQHLVGEIEKNRPLTR